MKKTHATEIVNLSSALSHPQFDPTLRSMVEAMAERPDQITLEQVLAALGFDHSTAAQVFLVSAVAAELVRLREVDACGGLN